jgi:hypothetical protein
MPNEPVRFDHAAHPRRLTPIRQRLVVAHISIVAEVIDALSDTSLRGRSFEELEELDALGSLALVEAALSYDPSSLVRFRAYALPRVRAALEGAIACEDTSEDVAISEVAPPVARARRGRPLDATALARLFRAVVTNPGRRGVRGLL